MPYADPKSEAARASKARRYARYKDTVKGITARFKSNNNVNAKRRGNR